MIWKSKREKEIELERERDPSFQNRHAPALRFGSMNPIPRLWGHGSMSERYTGSGFASISGQTL